MRLVLSLGVALWLSATGTQAVVILSDSFSYPDGAITNVGGAIWKRHNGGGSNEEALVVSGKLQLTSARSEDVNASLTNQPYTPGSGAVLYAALTVNFSALPSAAGTYFAHYNTSTHKGRIWASTTNAASGFFRLGIGNSSAATALSGQLTNNLALNTTYKVVTRYSVGSGVATIWLNPTAETDAGVIATDDPAAASITTFAFRQNSGMGTLLVDNLVVGTNFADVIGLVTGPPVITRQPEDQAIAEGGMAVFEVGAGGAPLLTYQWKFNGTNLTDATNATLILTNVLTNQAGGYSVVVSNALDFTNSRTASLTVKVIPPYQPAALSVLTYNVKGNGATNWSTNSLQVQAIGRQMSYLSPDIITFLEIPYDLSYEMTNFMRAFLPGYSLATNSGTDGAVRSMIASRFHIVRSTSWLDSVDLRSFGYSNANNSLDNFTRDLFEAEITVPNFPQHLHVFTTHLKATGTNYADAAAKRAAEAAAITNFFVTNLLVSQNIPPYLLTGDLNESDTNTLAIQRLISTPTGLHLTNPTNPFTGSINTFSSERIDYIFPCGLLFSNIANSQVFRTDQLNPTPPQILQSDNDTASDHWPVLMVFNNPYLAGFRLTSLTRSNQSVTLNWEGVTGLTYVVEVSSNLVGWSVLAGNLTAAGTNITFSTNLSGDVNFLRVRAP